MPLTEASKDGDGVKVGDVADESRNMEASMCALQLWPSRNRVCGSKARPTTSLGPAHVIRNSRNSRRSSACLG